MKLCGSCLSYESSSLNGYGFCRGGKTPEERSYMVRGATQPCWLSKGSPGLVPQIPLMDGLALQKAA